MENALRLVVVMIATTAAVTWLPITADLIAATGIAATSWLVALVGATIHFSTC